MANRFYFYFFNRRFLAAALILILVFCCIALLTSTSPQVRLETKKVNRTISNDNNNTTCGNQYCYTVPEFKFDCTYWNCSICFWGNDSCHNWETGIRADCPTRVCKNNPTPPAPPSPSDHDKYFFPSIRGLSRINYLSRDLSNSTNCT